MRTKTRLLAIFFFLISSLHFITASHAETTQSPAITVGLVYKTLNPYDRNVVQILIDTLSMDTTHTYTFVDIPIQDTEKNALIRNCTILVAIGSPAVTHLLNIQPPQPVVATMVTGETIRNALQWLKKNGEKGLTFLALELTVSYDIQFSILRRYFPDAKTVGVILKSGAADPALSAITAAAKWHGFTLVTAEIEKADDVLEALASLKDSADIIWSFVSSVINSLAIYTSIKYSHFNGIPYIGFSEKVTEAGALMSISCDYDAVGHQTARIVKQVIDGSIEDPIALIQAETPVVSLNTTVDKELFELDLDKVPIPYEVKTYRLKQ